MPWLPIYADQTDLIQINGWLNASKDLAFIVPDGVGRWKAVESLSLEGANRYCLWHKQSGPLPLLLPKPADETMPITNPWLGWEELRPGSDPSVPYFGPGHPGVFWFNCKPTSTRRPGSIGLSSFEWIGNHYRVLGEGADRSTESLWRSLRKWVAVRAQKIPRFGPIDGPDAEIFAFSSALEAIRSGVQRDANF